MSRDFRRTTEMSEAGENAFIAGVEYAKERMEEFLVEVALKKKARHCRKKLGGHFYSIPEDEHGDLVEKGLEKCLVCGREGKHRYASGGKVY